MKWEYHVKEIDFQGEDDFQEELNYWGDDGWELISTKWIHDDDVMLSVYCIFKRKSS